MLWRKAEEEISDWIENGKKALLVEGARQVGKTFLIEECLKKCGFPNVKIDLVDDKAMLKSLSKAAEEGTKAILEALSFVVPEANENGKPIVFIDEIQKCPELVTMIKYLVQDGRYRYILSGSLLGIALAHVRSLPVGYMGILTMYPLDFEEFAFNTGWNKVSLAALRKAFENQTPVNEALHERALSLFKRYLLVGGMPDAVNEYLSSGNFKRVKQAQQMIRELYKGDFTQREEGNPLILERIYDLVPRRLLDQNRRFMVSDLRPESTYSEYEDDFYWLSKSGALIPVYNVSSPASPYEISTSSKLVKLYYNDVGLLCSTYEDPFAQALLAEDEVNLGGIYENYVAISLLSSSSTPPFYFKSRKIGELDFLATYKGSNAAIEVKSGRYIHNHQSLEKMMAIPNYNLKKGIVLCNGNIEKEGEIIYLPIYMAGYIAG